MGKLLAVGPLPPTQRGTGRKRGTWRGHSEEAELLRKLAKRKPDEWGMVLERVQASRAQQVVSAIKNGTAADFPHEADGSKFTAHARKSKDQSGAPVRKGAPVTLYDVWARFLPPGSADDEAEEEGPVLSRVG